MDNKHFEAVDKKVLENTVQRCRERNVIIPTYEEMIHPGKSARKNKTRTLQYRIMGFASKKFI